MMAFTTWPEGTMTDPMSRIPLSREEETTVSSMSRWMRFMAVVGICGSLFIVVIVVLASGAYSTMRHVTISSSDPKWAKAQQQFAALGSLPYAIAAVFLLLAAIAIWQNMSLHHAGDDFNLVATTDSADVEYLARGFDRLKTFFKIQVLTVAVTFTVILITGIVAGVLAAHGGGVK
jgi:hypothetical protein